MLFPILIPILAVAPRKMPMKMRSSFMMSAPSSPLALSSSRSCIAPRRGGAPRRKRPARAPAVGGSSLSLAAQTMPSDAQSVRRHVTGEAT
eukprot:2112437-Prymnesium_polylepis.2